MGVGIQMKKILRDKNMTIKQLSQKTGISLNTLYSITKRDSERVDRVVLQRIADALGVHVLDLAGISEQFEGYNIELSTSTGKPSVQDITSIFNMLSEKGKAEFLTQIGVIWPDESVDGSRKKQVGSGSGRAVPSLPDDARKVAEDYKGLDLPGKRMVKVVIAEEQKRVAEEQAKRKEKELWLDDPDEFGEQADPRVIPLYFTPAAAGFASPAFGEDFEYIQVGGDVPQYADFAVKIDGDSMEPYIMDGATVYVNRDPLANGDVGIFFVDGDMLCKQYYKDERGRVHLLSLNRDRSDADRVLLPGGGVTLSCCGRVILPHQPKIAIL